jgi:hypothetical protein
LLSELSIHRLYSMAERVGEYQSNVAEMMDCQPFGVCGVEGKKKSGESRDRRGSKFAAPGNIGSESVSLHAAPELYYARGPLGSFRIHFKILSGIGKTQGAAMISI